MIACHERTRREETVQSRPRLFRVELEPRAGRVLSACSVGTTSAAQHGSRSDAGLVRARETAAMGATNAGPNTFLRI